MRCFIAIPVPDNIKDHAWKVKNLITKSTPDIKWVEYDNYHLTLKFLGDVETDSITALKTGLNDIAKQMSAFTLQIKGMGFFPNKRHPRVLWMGIQGETDKADMLGEKVDDFLLQLGFEPEKKRSFHLTLGRIRSDYHLEKVVEKIDMENQKPELITFAVDEFKLMRSNLSPRGPQYEVIEAFKLTK